MKILVVAANGKAGSLIVDEALRRGHDVTAAVRNENKTAAKNVIVKDLFALTREDLAGFDAVVSAFGAFTPETLPLHSKSVDHFAEILDGSDARLLIVGGAGSLYVNEERTIRLVDTPEFPAEYKPLALAQADELTLLRTKENICWTFVSPAADFRENGEKTGNYAISGEIFTTNEAGESFVSYIDYASAMLDVIESGKHVKERISVYNK